MEFWSFTTCKRAELQGSCYKPEVKGWQRAARRVAHGGEGSSSCSALPWELAKPCRARPEPEGTEPASFFT